MSFKLGGGLFKHFGEWLFVVFIVSEEEDGCISGAEDGLDVVLGELNEGGDGTSQQEVNDWGGLEGARVGEHFLFEVSEQSKARVGCHSMLVSALLGVHMVEFKFVTHR